MYTTNILVRKIILLFCYIFQYLFFYTVLCYIFFKRFSFFSPTANNHGTEQLTVTETKSTLPPQSQSSTNDLTRSSTSDSDLDSMHLMLEPSLRPATPDPTSRLSQQIFEEHKDLAKEYLKVSSRVYFFLHVL